MQSLFSCLSYLDSFNSSVLHVPQSSGENPGKCGDNENLKWCAENQMK